MKKQFVIEVAKAIGWRWLIIILVLWTAVTDTTQRFKCPKMTQTEIYLNIQNWFLLDFKECE